MTNYKDIINNNNIIAAATDIHNNNTGTHCGLHGNTAENTTNYVLGVVSRCLTVQPPTKTDCVKYHTDKEGKKRRLKIEVKTGCGALATLDENGDITESPTLSSDFIIYFPTYIPVTGKTRADIFHALEQQCYVLEVNLFMDILHNCGLLRKKHSGTQCKRKKQGLPHYNDLLTIQTFKNSRKKEATFLEALSFEGMTLSDFCLFYGINIKGVNFS